MPHVPRSAEKNHLCNRCLKHKVFQRDKKEENNPQVSMDAYTDVNQALISGENFSNLQDFDYTKFNYSGPNSVECLTGRVQEKPESENIEEKFKKQKKRDMFRMRTLRSKV